MSLKKGNDRKTMNLDFINQKLQNAQISLDVFGVLNGSVLDQLKELKSLYRLMSRVTHPDANSSTDKKTAEEAFIKLTEWYDLALRDIEANRYGQRPTTKIKTNKNVYIVNDVFASGDVSDVFDCFNEKDKTKALVLKVISDKQNNDLINNEVKVLKQLYAHTGGFFKLISNHIPKIIEAFEVDGKQAIVFEKLTNYHSLGQIMQAYPKGIHERNVVWMFNRLLAAQSTLHGLNLVHGNILPQNFMISPEDHNGKLIDFTNAVGDDQKLKTMYPDFQEFYPPEVLKRGKVTSATDIYMSAACMVKLAGGDLKTKEMPDNIPLEVRNFFKACLIENLSFRPCNALALHEEFREILKQIWGQPKFFQFDMPKDT